MVSVPAVRRVQIIGLCVGSLRESEHAALWTRADRLVERDRRPRRSGHAAGCAAAARANTTGANTAGPNTAGSNTTAHHRPKHHRPTRPNTAPPANYLQATPALIPASSVTTIRPRASSTRATGRRRMREPPRRHSAARAATVPGRRTSTTTRRDTSSDSARSSRPRSARPASPATTAAVTRGGKAARTKRETSRCTTCHSVHKPQSFEHQLVKATRDAAVRDLSSPAGREDRARGGAHAGPRGQDVVLVVPQPARLDQQRQGPQGREFGQRAVHELSRRDARADAVRARAGARELHDLPRSARLVERSHAERTHADAVSALSRRDQTSVVGLRQRRDHDEQEQPHVRTVVRELPLRTSTGRTTRRASSSCGSAAGQDVCDHCFSHVFAVR